MRMMNNHADSAIRMMTDAATLSTDQDLAWIAASRGGDVQAFNRLVLKWERRVYNVALRMLRDREEAAEVTQESFLSAWRGVRNFRQHAKFSTWLYRIVINQCLTRLSHRPPGIHLPLTDDEAEPNYPSVRLQITETQPEALLREEQSRRVLAAMELLPPNQRAVVELKFFQELTFEEIGVILDTPQSTVKSRLYSALETLKSKLGCEI